MWQHLGTVSVGPSLEKQIPISNADFVIEGYVDPTEPLRDGGPFGEHTGYYTLPEPYHVFHVTTITHRKDDDVRRKIDSLFGGSR